MACFVEYRVHVHVQERKKKKLFIIIFHATMKIIPQRSIFISTVN